MKNALFTRFLCCLFLVGSAFMPSKSNAQAWAFKGGYGSSTGTDRCSGIALDASGNAYITGSFTGTMDFGTGPITAVGNLDGFIAKFSPAGVCQWTVRFAGPGTAQDQGLGIATNGTSVFVGGVFQTSMSINGGTAITGYGGIDGFGMKLDAATGAVQWTTLVGSGSTDAVQAMCIDNSGNMYITGYFSSNATYPTATFGSFTRSTNGGTGTDAYVAKLDGGTGNVLWVSNGGMSGYNDNVSNAGVAYVPTLNSVVMVGSFQSPSAGMTSTYATASPASNVTLTSQGGLDIHVLKMDANTGAFQSGIAVAGASSSNEEALAAAYDSYSQKVVLTGYFNTGALTFGSTPTINPIGSDDIFYAAYDPATNNFTWAKSAGSTIQDRGQSIGTNGAGSVFITGRYRNTMNAPTASTPLTIVSSRTSSADEIYLLEVNSTTGNATRLLTPVGDATITTGDIGTGVASRAGKTWLGGMFGGTISFPGLGTLTTSGGTTADILLSRFDAPVALPVRLQSFTADLLSDDVRLTWITASETDNDHFEVERSTDGRTFRSIGQSQAAGTAHTYNLTDPAVSNTGATSVWYRLRIVARNGSASYSQVVRVSLGKKSIEINALPNPFHAGLHLNLNMPANADVHVSISDMAGRQVVNRTIQVSKGFSTEAITEADKLVNGVYNLVIDCNGQKTIQRIIKQ